MRLDKYKRKSINHIVKPIKKQRDSALQIKEQLLGFTYDILDKQFRTYIWNESKSNALITIDAALIAGVLIFFQLFKYISVVSLILMGVSFLFFILSFIICLVHTIPRIDAKIGNKDNLRTIICIRKLNRTEYHDQIKELKLDQMIKLTSYQISGMTQNNLKGQRLISKGINLTILGVVCLTVLLTVLVIQNIILKGC
jgi:Na+-transporting methylmalonyl-CoA/oxaloacetate decarboxylase gamma subunit